MNASLAPPTDAPDAGTASTSAHGDLRGACLPAFPPDTGFHAELKDRVLAYFRESGVPERDNPAMYLKTAVLLLWFVASYALLVFAAATWWQASLLALSLALAMAGIGFGIQHDANHGAYSRHLAVNRLLGATLDGLGGSSYVWRTKHNVTHHTYTNLTGADADIDLGPIGRLAPQQRRLWFHGAQHFYLWIMYGLLAVKWNFVSDFRSLAKGRIAQSRIPSPGGVRLVELGAGKLLFFGWALVLPAFFHPWWVVVLGYAGVSFVLGFVLSVVFQLAHCVEEAAFPAPPSGGQRLRDGWAEHQVRTTVDFARENRLLTWYLGGLNFQIEHHLFPRVCHVHYPRIARIVQSVCAEHGVPYAAHATLRGAVASHARWLRRMGRQDRPGPGIPPGGPEEPATTAGALPAAHTLPATSLPPGIARESVDLLDGGAKAYPRMLEAIARAKRSVHLQVYAFAPTGVGASFVEALQQAARRGVSVDVQIDGWGSARSGNAIAGALRQAGCHVRIYNRLLALLVGRLGRNHRKLLLVDDEVAFLGGINIGDEYAGDDRRAGWADLALEIRGPQCASLGRTLRREPHPSVRSSLRIVLCGLGGGWHLRRRYVGAFTDARERIDVAHGYFLPDRGVVRALTAAARRGVRVRLLLAGATNSPFAQAATRSLYRRLLAAGVGIHEWSGSVLHAKVATVDGRRLLVGSFNLDPFSLANLECLVDVEDAPVVGQAERWIRDHFDRSRPVTSHWAWSPAQRWLLDPLGRLAATLAEATSLVMARRTSGRGRTSVAEPAPGSSCRSR